MRHGQSKNITEPRIAMLPDDGAGEITTAMIAL
jgi:hypothetical protein